MFEGRRGGEEIEAEISSLFARFFTQESICNLEKLSVVPAAWCWAIYVDVLSKSANLPKICVLKSAEKLFKNFSASHNKNILLLFWSSKESRFC